MFLFGKYNCPACGCRVTVPGYCFRHRSWFNRVWDRWFGNQWYRNEVRHANTVPREPQVHDILRYGGTQMGKTTARRQAAERVMSDAEAEMQKVRIGDVVSRTGHDEHLVYTNNHVYVDPADGKEKVSYWGTNFDLVCIKEPMPLEGDDEPYIKIGETESNLIRRYSYKYRLINYKEKLQEIGREDLIPGERVEE